MSTEVDRIQQLRSEIAERQLDAMLITSGPNRRWLSGFTGSAGTLLVAASTAHLITDSRYYEQAEQQAQDFVLERAGYETIRCLGELVAEKGIERLGFEAETVTVDQLRKYREKLPEIDWAASTGLVDQFRAIKQEHEIEIIRRAAVLADQTMEHAYAVARPGMTELELAWQLEVFMREGGAESLAFDTIVAAGENGALPHHHPGQRVIEAGDPIVIDLGARIDGYCSDLTRTFSIGPASDLDYQAVWTIVDEANRRAVEGLRAGPSGPVIDALARDHIEQAGYGEQFGHSLGHGVGLEVHEAPRLSRLAGEAPLEPGMVVTIEPGIYLPGRFGVRIEDLAVVRESSAELLSTVQKLPILASVSV